ncbi:hypothetical protein GA0115245_13125, partial [Streptomyces sp. di188]
AGFPPPLRPGAHLQDDQADARLDPAETPHTRGCRPLDLARDRRPHPATTRPGCRGRSPPPLGEAGRAVPAHPGPRPPRVSQPPPAPALPGPRAETLNARTREASWLEEPAPGHPSRRGQNNQTPRNHHRTKQDESPQRLNFKLSCLVWARRWLRRWPAGGAGVREAVVPWTGCRICVGRRLWGRGAGWVAVSGGVVVVAYAVGGVWGGWCRRHSGQVGGGPSFVLSGGSAGEWGGRGRWVPVQRVRRRRSWETRRIVPG